MAYKVTSVGPKGITAMSATTVVDVDLYVGALVRAGYRRITVESDGCEPAPHSEWRRREITSALGLGESPSPRVIEVGVQPQEFIHF